MGFRSEVERGAHDGLLIENLRRFSDDYGGNGHATVAPRYLPVDDDPVLRAENYALAKAVHEGRMEPGAMFEAILTGPGRNTFTAFTAPSTASQALAAEDHGWIRGDTAAEGAAASVFGQRGIEVMVRYLFWLYGHNPLARNIINNYTFFTMGEGFRVVFKTDAGRRMWKETSRRVNWRRRTRKAIQHTYLLGEWFAVFYPLTQAFVIGQDGTLASGSNLDPRDPDDEIVKMRNLGPEAILRVVTVGDPQLDPTGIQDAEAVIGYLRTGGGILGAADVSHYRADEIGNLTRGVSILFPVLRYLRYIEKFVENRHWLNFIRARIPAIRRVHGGAAAVAGQKTAYASLPPPGTVAIENLATEWQFPEMKLDADDARHDGRLLLLMIASGVNLPEVVVTGDASNANYSASFAAEAPMVKMFEGLQSETWIPQFREDVQKLTGADDEDFEITAGAVIRRNIKVMVEAFAPMINLGVLSKKSVREKLGFDHEQEEEQIKKEQEEERDRLGRGEGDDDDPVPDTKIPKKKPGRPEKDDPGGETAATRKPRPSETADR